jgi:hypothetical protein
MVLSQYGDWDPTHGDERAPAKDVVQMRQIQLADTIDQPMAGRMLRELASLYIQACRKPFGLFDDTAERLVVDRDAALEAFTTFTTGGDYATSNEAVVYGGQPDFSQVFDCTNPERWRSALAFYERLFGLTEVSYDRKKKVYVYAPYTP